jgi:hypothetical protein
MKRHVSAGSVYPFYRPIQNQVSFSYKAEKDLCQYIYMAIYMAFIHNVLLRGARLVFMSVCKRLFKKAASRQINML